ncbi:SP_1767 family glycosyltransferase [Streptococcus panodentis]|uniref:SP_1767 family glycosyltransferase n=1 Tax=Streptococcus panodentis TaxID=1581472 RepID=A0ABS5AY40_9STRE|nr:SP_1767 family glycosyltransferase [Streptococcus panodentis]MBP2621176.1 SP_1767 family glycosyltransferase [Streptococcus panodentis]
MQAIVLIGDQDYLEPLSTAIKSILYYNKNVKLYVLNRGIATEWFCDLQELAGQLESELLPVSLDQAAIPSDWQTQDHISSMTYARYFIPQFVAEDRVLYLDSDVIVKGELQPLFELDLQGRAIAAAGDAGGYGFNAGVLLIDNRVWKERQLSAVLIRETERIMEAVQSGQFEDFNGDQTVLNQVFGQDWLPLDKIYNLQVGHDLVAFYSGWTGHFELEQEPIIIHYTTYRKPWNSVISYRYRQLWWDFQALSLEEIAAHHEGAFELPDSWEQAALNCLILTNVQELEQIEFLAQALPTVHFHIACYTEMGDYLRSLDRYDNIQLYPQVVEAVLDEMIGRCQLYLDIHHGTEQYEMGSRFKAAGKPVLTFDNTQKNEAADFVYPHANPQEMVEKLRSLMKKAVPEGYRAVVLAADYLYSDQVSTTIKSIVCHNRFIKFYLINSDFPAEWFVSMEKRLAKLDCRIVNARVDSSHISHYKTNIHYAVFLRYFAADFVTESQALYLDCDIVVTRDLTPLFERELGQAPLAAVKDLGGQVYFGEQIFNSGVLLINIKLWREAGVAQQLIEMTDQLHDQVSQDDQSILNLLFENRWLELPFAYNCITLHMAFSDYVPELGLYPPVIHYLTERKPWKEFTQSIYRELWWFYHGLDWADLQEPIGALTEKMVNGPAFSCLVYTYSCDLLHIDDLIRSLPACHFYIAAPVVVAEPISRLLRYSNVSVSSDIAGIPGFLESLAEKAQLLLDINAGDEVDGIISRFRSAGKPVFAFDSTAHGQQGQELFAADQPAEMAAAIEALRLQEPEERKIEVLPIEQTLDYLLEHGSSAVRFGDGEMDIIAGHSIAYQDYQPELAERLREMMAQESSERLIICLSDVFEGLERYLPEARNFWKWHLHHHLLDYQTICRAPWYGSTFISRPYIDLVDKSLSAGYFDKLKRLWQDRDLLIVEGAASRSGVGNDLFAAAKSIKRIICPSRNAYSRLEDIKAAVREQAGDRLILAMLGPAAKVLVYDLVQEGYRALDIGHIDSEYEWFQMGATHKVKLAHKHTAEYNFDQDIEVLPDRDYERQIAVNLTEQKQ